MAKNIMAGNSASFDKSNLEITTERLDDVVLLIARVYELAES